MVDKLIVIVGQTASGKSALALELARKFDGEIICADARTIYEGMDIGTAKPSAEDQAAIPHHIIDILKPDQVFTVADFKELAQQVIADIQARGKLPIMVGGTGLYVDAVLFDYSFSDTQAARDPQNPRHAVVGSGTRKPIDEKTLVIGISAEKEALDERIEKRVSEMMEQGLEDEVRGLEALYGWGAPGMNAIGYREWRNESDVAQVTENILKDSRSYAKRQKTWFKRNKSIQWIDSPQEAEALVAEFIGKD